MPPLGKSCGPPVAALGYVHQAFRNRGDLSSASCSSVSEAGGSTIIATLSPISGQAPVAASRKPPWVKRFTASQRCDPVGLRSLRAESRESPQGQPHACGSL